MMYIIILLAIITRFIPHLPNFAPITALAIFSGANLGWKKSVALTLAARFISDMFLGFFAWPLMLAVYASHLVGILFGVWIKKTAMSTPSEVEGSANGGNTGNNRFLAGARNGKLILWIKIISSSLFSSAIFFLVTNFAFFYASYGHNLSGILAAYANGLPFFRGTMLGDLAYTSALFGAYQLVLYAKPNKQRVAAALT